MFEKCSINQVLVGRFEDELLTVAAEECSEVIVEICKASRFGPDTAWDGQSARQRLARELGQLTHVIEEILDHGFVDRETFFEGYHEKRNKLRTWMRHHPEDPTDG